MRQTASLTVTVQDDTTDPVQGTNFFHAITFCNKLSLAEGLTPADGQGAGTNTTDYLKAFAGSTGSNAIEDYAWFYSDTSSEEKTQIVGTKTANELGLFDMSGNVKEWNWVLLTLMPQGH